MDSKARGGTFAIAVAIGAVVGLVGTAAQGLLGGLSASILPAAVTIGAVVGAIGAASGSSLIIFLLARRLDLSGVGHWVIRACFTGAISGAAITYLALFSTQVSQSPTLYIAAPALLVASFWAFRTARRNSSPARAPAASGRDLPGLTISTAAIAAVTLIVGYVSAPLATGLSLSSSIKFVAANLDSAMTLTFLAIAAGVFWACAWAARSGAVNRYDYSRVSMILLSVGSIGINVSWLSSSVVHSLATQLQREVPPILAVSVLGIASWCVLVAAAILILTSLLKWRSSEAAEASAQGIDSSGAPTIASERSRLSDDPPRDT